MNLRLLQLFRSILPLGQALCLFAFSAQRQGPDPMLLPLWSYDKLIHFAIYGLLASGWRRAGLPAWAAFLATVICGLIDEGLQGLNPHRVFDTHDLAADAAGALVAMLVWTFWPAYRQVLEWRPLAGWARTPVS